MSFKTGKTIRIFVFIVFISLYNCCSENRKKTDNNSYKIVELLKDGECSVYSMRFVTGNDVLFKLSTSGDCRSIQPELFLKSYRIMLEEYKNVNHSDLTSKIILLEFSDEISIPHSKIKMLTEKLLSLCVKFKTDQNKGFEKLKIEIN